uniref:Tudor domain-containing protein Tdr21 n=1 Tax=Locusta migratoria TaxID=7004 RepID=A0AAU7J954_LOCMI
MLRKLTVGRGISNVAALENKKETAYAYSDHMWPSYPEDVVNHRHEILHEELPGNIWRGSELQVFVRKVNSPSEFWINLCGLEYSRKLVNVRANMKKFYEQADDKYLFPRCAVRFGHFCVCVFRNEWHRARVVKTDETDVNLVEVFLVDCGGTVSVGRENLRLMHKTFSYLPIQGFVADLPDIKPKDSAAWPNRVCEFFREETSGKRLRAKLVDLVRERHSVSLKLFDVNGNCISKKLMSNGMAETVAEHSPPTECKECVDTRHTECVDTSNKESVESRSKESSNKVPANSSVGVSLVETATISEGTPESGRSNPLPEEETTSSSVDSPSSWRNIDHKYVTIAGKLVLLVTINDKSYFVLSDFLQAFALFHEHVVLKLLEAFPTQVVVEKMDYAEIRLLLANLRDRRIRGTSHLIDNGIVPSVNLLPVNVACQLLKFLGEDSSQTIYVHRFVSSLS